MPAAPPMFSAEHVDVDGDFITHITAQTQIVQLPAEAYVPIAEVEAPLGIDNLPPRPGEFVGRQRELDDLTAVFTGPGAVKVAVVHGLGGIGKSTLVAQWAATRRHGFAPIVRIIADNQTNITTGLVKLATQLQPAVAKALNDEQLADRALQWLATHSDWLLVLDNADDPDLVAPVLARVGTSGRVVITSRRASGWQPGTPIVRLGVLEPAESLRLLTALSTIDGPRDTDGAAELCAELGHLPLAIQQVGAYLGQDQFLTPRGYLQLLAEYPAEMYERAAESELDTDTGSERTIARIWRVTLDRISRTETASVEMLRTLAWYGPDAIPLTLCRWQELAPPRRSSALGLLTAYNMITPDMGRTSLSIHRLVQAVTRTPDLTDPHRQPDAIQRARTRATETLYTDLPDYRDPAMWPAWRARLPHIDALTGHTVIGSDFTIAAIRSATGAFLEGQGAYDRALNHLRHALADRRLILGDNHPHTLVTRNNLASVYRAVGRLAEAIDLYERIVSDSARVLGVDHATTLTSRNNLAHAYESAGRFTEAIISYEQLLLDEQQFLSGDHPSTLTTRHNLAHAYAAVGRFTEAIPLLQSNLADRRRVLGDDHPHTLHSRNDLANAYRSVGRLAEAISLLEQLLPDSTRIVGTDHPATLDARHNLAHAYESAGQLAEAITLYKRLLPDRERILGNDNPATQTTVNNLAHAYESVGRFGEAIALYERLLADSARILGDDHPDTLTTGNNLAHAYQSAGRQAEAVLLFERTLADFVRILGNDNPRTYIARNNLAMAYRSVGRLTEMIPLLERNLTDRQRVLGSEHPDILVSRNNLAFGYESTGRVDEAIVLYEQLLPDWQRILGDDHPNTLICRHNVAGVYRVAGRVDEAIVLYEQLLPDWQRILGDDHPNTMRSRNGLALAYVLAGRVAEAITLHERNLADRQRVLGADHPETQASRDNLAAACEQRDSG
ncbi:tetratricopeptide repeat protein [Nocardia takedensis]